MRENRRKQEKIGKDKRKQKEIKGDNVLQQFDWIVWNFNLL